MKRLTLLFALVVLFAPSAAYAQYITGMVVEAQTGEPLASDRQPYVSIQLEQYMGGQLVQVAGTDCYNNFAACADANGSFSIRTHWDGKPLSGSYVLTVSSPTHIKTSRKVEVGLKGVNVGDVQLNRSPAGFAITSVMPDPNGNTVVKGFGYSTLSGPRPALVARMTYSGPGVTVSYVQFDLPEHKPIVWKEGSTFSEEVTFTLPSNAKIIDGSSFSGWITMERAESSLYSYARSYFFAVKGIRDFIGW